MDTLTKFLKSNLRRISGKWKPIYTTRNNARRPYVGSRKNQKYEYQCALCKKWLLRSKTQVDHIIPVGGLHSLDDLRGYVERLFCEEKGLRLLCVGCHLAHTTSSLAKKKKPSKKKKKR